MGKNGYLIMGMYCGVTATEDERKKGNYTLRQSCMILLHVLYSFSVAYGAFLEGNRTVDRYF